VSKTFQEKYGPWALVTGASAGIGKEIAREIARRGLNVVIVARREDVLNDIAEQFRDNLNVEVRVVVADFSQPGASQEVAEAVADLDIGLVVPNAGIEITGEFIATELAQLNRLNQINVVAPTELAHLFGRRLARRGHGGLMLLSSLVAYQGTPLLGAYAAGKAYILSLGEALNVELGRQGIDVTVLSPGVTDTDMVKNIAVDFSKMPLFAELPWHVARTGLNALGRKASVVSGRLNKVYAFENRFLPRMVPTKLFGFLLRRALKPGAPLWDRPANNSASVPAEGRLALAPSAKNFD
jgi:short-subunit dehydrogenase